MTTTNSHEAMHWDLFRQADKIAHNGGEHNALDILYYLEIQELPPALRVLVNTTLATADTAPDYRQKMEWIGEARFVLINHKESLENDADGPTSRISLEGKIRAAEIVVRTQMGLPPDDFDDDDVSGDEDEDEIEDGMEEDEDEDDKDDEDDEEIVEDEDEEELEDEEEDNEDHSVAAIK